MVLGNVIVGQSGGPTAVINSSLAGVFKAAKDRRVKTVYGMLYGVEGLLNEQYVDLSDHLENETHLELLKRTPSSYLGSCRYKLPAIGENDAIYEKIFTLLDKLHIKYFLYIGGNDSTDTVKKLSDYGKLKNSDIVFVGVPKTIDNDLEVTDHTPGYGSAAKFISTMLKEIIKDNSVYNIKQITVVEIMGRNTGWLAGASGLARTEDCDGPDLIYLPELTFDMDAFMKRVIDLQKEKKQLTIAVSEGVKLHDGRYVCELKESKTFKDAFGHRVLTGTAHYLASKLTNEIGSKTRAIEFSTMQRCASHFVSGIDISEAFIIGGHAMKAAFEGQNAKMAIFERFSDDPYLIKTSICDVGLIANIEKKVPVEWISEDGAHLADEFYTYSRPLIQSEFTPFMVAGVTRHLKPIV